MPMATANHVNLHRRPLPPTCRKSRIEMEGHARDYGLDFFPTIFELIDADQLNAIAAYGGFPTRYPHWRFGMEYEQLCKGLLTTGCKRSTRLVINNNPCYAYLMRRNAAIDQKLVMAHVYGHCDFFKNNYWFSKTNRKMMDEMANHGNRVRRYMDRCRRRRGRRLHRRLLERRGPDRHPFAVHQASRRDAASDCRRATSAGRRRIGRADAVRIEGLHGFVHQSARRSLAAEAAKRRDRRPSAQDSRPNRCAT